MPIALLLVHRHPMFAEALAKALEDADGHRCTVMVPQSSGATPTLPVQCDLCLFDATLPYEFCDGVWSRLAAENSECRSALLVGAEARDLSEFATLAAQGCVSEDESLHSFRAALTSMASGRTYCSPQLGYTLMHQLWREFHSAPNAGNELRLTIREWEILRLIAVEELSNKELASRLHVSVYTIKNHVHRILEKLGVDDRRQAAEAAHRRRLFLPSRTAM